jgi:hypothetical protein
VIPRRPALASCERGATIIEFAIIAPVFLLLTLGGLELAHTMYVRSVLIGQLQKASRDISLEDATSATRQDAIETSVEDAVKNAIPTATVKFDYKSYHDYGNAEDPSEEYNDANHSGVCDKGEAFVDGNRNGRWDADGGTDGRGGAKDVVLLTATVSYPRLPLAALIGNNSPMVLTAKTLLRNQPNDQQADLPTGTCK